MSIPASTIYNQLLSLLDAEGSNFWDVNLDVIPAINRAQKYIVSIINSVMGAKKFAESYARELTKVLIFQTSQYSRVDLTPAQPYIFWDILSIVALPVLDIPFVPTPVLGGLSTPLPARIYRSGGFSCARTNAMEALDNRNNPMKGGYNLEPAGKNLKYAYVQFADYFNGLNAVPNEIEINPFSPALPIAIFVVIMPPDITALSANLPFPTTFTDVLTKVALKEISVKSGDNTTTFGISEQDIQMFLKTLM